VGKDKRREQDQKNSSGTRRGGKDVTYYSAKGRKGAIGEKKVRGETVEVTYVKRCSKTLVRGGEGGGLGRSELSSRQNGGEKQ